LGRSLRVPGALIAAVIAAYLVGTASAFAYTSGSTGYDIGYLQCGTTYPTGSFGIVGVDSGWPFISSLHPGNPCLASAFAHANGTSSTVTAGLYVNTGYDPTYTDSNHTTADCVGKSANVSGTSAQKAAWAAGCSEAEKDLGYVTSVGIGNPAGWWLDVETANSWCGQPYTNCTDLSLNGFTIQGLIDVIHLNSSSPIGLYSTSAQWTAIVGSGSVSGVSTDWYATGLRSSKGVTNYCSSKSFNGLPVSLVQWTPSSTSDRDYACGAPATPDFTLSATPASQSVIQGSPASYTVNLTPTNGFSGSVAFSTTGLPTDATATYNPNASGSSSALSVTTATTTPAGSYPLTITGTSASLSHTTSVTVQVTAARKPDFSLGTSPSSRSLLPGGSTTYAVTVTPSNGFNNPVTLSGGGLPAGATMSFSPSPVASGSSTMTLATSTSTRPGSYVITITGTGGGLTHTTTVTLVVNSPNDCNNC
jgi:hypothetical protein